MLDSLNWWFSLRRNATFHEWMREQYTREQLRALVKEATDADLCHPYNPLAQDLYLDGGLPVLRKTVQRLYSRYGAEIWSACYRAAAKGRPSTGYDLFSSWLAAFDGLPMAFQVIEPPMFEEFLVRNALRQCA